MKKVYKQALQEILAADVTTSADYLESAFTLFARDFLQTSSGVLAPGLFVTSGSVSTLSVAVGAIFNGSVFGELESPSGVTVTFPTGGVRTDLVAASYLEVLDTNSSGYVIVDVTTQAETIQTNPTRKFGACQITLFQSTTALTCPAGYIPLAEVTSSTSTITNVSDVRLYCVAARFTTDIKQLFNSVFFAGI